MCGIIGYIGKENAISMVKDGLKNLEYRGYDSAGISFFENCKIKTIKKAGTVDNLFLFVEKSKTSNIAIGHTRWATHGKANDKNSHPHSSFYGKVSIVHNGIIENYVELKQRYLLGIKLKSETDTEVLCNLIEKNYILIGDRLRAISETMQNVKGSYSVAILFNDDEKHIYFAKNFSPLLIGKSQTGNFVASDVLGFCGKADKFIEINDMELGYISQDDIKIYDINLKSKTFVENFMLPETSNVSKGKFPYFMLKETNEIPQSVFDTANLYKGEYSPLEKLKTIKNEINRIWLVGCGTSYHSCFIGQKLFVENGYDTSIDIASEFIYSVPILDEHTLCIFLSQSGETADTISAVKIAREKGAKTACITNVSTSTITKICDFVLPMKCGPEIAVASTKAYNSQLCVLYILSEYFKKSQNNVDEVIETLKEISKVIDIKNFEEQIKPLVKEVISKKTIFMVGRDYDYALSMESALKLKEISYLNCWSLASGELKHGTIALVDSDTILFAFLTQKELVEKTMNVVMQTKARGAKICLVSQFESVLNDKNADFTIKLPIISEKYYPILAVVSMQLLAYYVSTTLGNNPDKPRNLAKSVTVE